MTVLLVITHVAITAANKNYLLNLTKNPEYATRKIFCRRLKLLFHINNNNVYQLIDILK